MSFDHYFATYPQAANTSGQTFNGTTPNGTPVGLGGPVNNLANTVGSGNVGNLLTNNPNSAAPQRFDPALDSNVLTCSVNHNYKPEQLAFDNGLMDKFPENVGVTSARPTGGGNCTKAEDMNYYDGNTVTAFWNYAQHFAMNDNNYNTNFGPSSPGAVNLVSGNTGGIDATHSLPQPFTGSGNVISDGSGGFSMIGDQRPFYDDCNPTKNVATSFTGKNIGDELNDAGLSWGWFQGGMHAEHAVQRSGQQQREPVQQPDGAEQRPAGPVRDHPQHRHRVGWHGYVRCEAVRRHRRLHLAPRAVRLLRDDGQPAPPGSHVALRRRHRHAALRRARSRVRHGEPPVRHEHLRHPCPSHRAGLAAEQPAAGGELPEGARVPGRPPGLLRPDRRAEVRHQGDQRARADA